MAKKTEINVSNISGGSIVNINSTTNDFWDILLTIKNIVIPLPKPDFIVGRNATIKLIRDTFNKQDAIVIHGLGGIGKTLTVREYYHQYSSKYDKMMWLNASNGVYEAFINGNVIEQLYLSERIGELQKNGSSKEIIIDTILERLSKINKGLSLLALDNVPYLSNRNESYEIHEFILSKLKGLINWKIICTSRAIISAYEPIIIGFLETKYAVQLFNQYYKANISEKDIKKVINSAGFHTLTIEMIAKTAQFLSWDSHKLMNRIEENGIGISNNTNFYLEHAQKNITDTSILNYLSSIFSISEIDDIGLTVLRFMSILSLDKVKKEILLDLFLVTGESELENKNEEDNFNRVVKNLILSGWLGFEEKEEIYSLHPIIKEVVLLKEKQNITYENFETIIYNLTILVAYHCDTINEGYNDILEISLNVLQLFENETYSQLVRLSSVSSNLCGLISQFEKSFHFAQLGEKILQNRIEKNTSKTDLDVIDEIIIYGSIADAYGHQSMYEEAYQKVRITLACAETIEVLEKEKALIVIRAYERYSYYSNRLEINKMNDSRNYAYKALDIIEQFKLQNTLEASNIYNVLKMIHQHYEEYEDAIKYGNLSIEIKEKRYSDNHPTLPLAHNNIVTTYLMMDDYRNALKHTMIAKKYCEKYPITHISQLAQCYSNIGMAFEKEGNITRERLKRAIHSANKDYQEFLAKSNYLINDPRLDRLFNKAIDNYKLAVSIFQQLMMEDNVAIANVYKSIANTYGALGKFSSVIKYTQMALKIYEYRLPETHHLIGESHMSLALGNRDLKKFQKSKYHVDIAIAIYEKVYPNEDNIHITEALKLKKEVEKLLKIKNRRTKA